MTAPAESTTPATDQSKWRTLDFDQLVLGSTVAVIVLVALFAAYVSYGHAFELIHTHGESRSAAVFGSGTVDGLVYASGMVLLQAARYRRRAPWLAYFGLWLGIVATIGANVAHGVSHGRIGALVSAWPAVALIVAYELLMKIIRTGAAKGGDAGADQDAANADDCPHGVALTVHVALVNAYLHSRDCEGDALSQRQLSAAFGIDRKKVAELVRPHDRQALEPVTAEPSLNGSAAT